MYLPCANILGKRAKRATTTASFTQIPFHPERALVNNIRKNVVFNYEHENLFTTAFNVHILNVVISVINIEMNLFSFHALKLFGQ